MMIFDQWHIHGFDRQAAVRHVRNGINFLPAVFLSSRGILDPSDAEEFLTDSRFDIIDPLLMPDMAAAAARVRRAVEDGEKIAVFGDYDVDGMTASVLLKLWFDEQSADAIVYIPDRGDEGYGLSRSALDWLAARNVNLVVTVDCGITAADEVEYGRGLGLDFVITDHHESRFGMPQGVPVVDAKRADSEYPNRHLAGVGVAFKLVCALEDGCDPFKLLEKYGDLVAVGTVADVMPVVGENRALIRAGLKKLRTSPRPGLTALMKAANAPRTAINTAAIGFTIAPRLNAAGRMGNAGLSVDILLTNDYREADRLTEELTALNDRRRELEGEIFEEVKRRLEGQDIKSPVVMSGDNWYHGVMGIVAARTAEKWNIPAVMINIDEDGTGRGSCRSFGGFGIYSALAECGDLLTNYGGHEMATGITIPRENIDELRERLTAIYLREVTEPVKPKLKIDFEVEKPELLEIENVEALEALEPFGNGYPPPILAICGVRIVNLNSVGGGKHARIRVEKNHRMLDGIFFSADPESLGFVEGALIDVAFEPQINQYRGRVSVQLHVLDIRPHRKERAVMD
ncbi:MAG: single-stranded-DNA-specific exonuclease RecJ [Oscillospiraceae bacterium]|jgi:single-stranded-DNA-specific exonuclease|nr:single-stranded-DNA-specific exonuclease RecJ [Oscillospiraceae bacterium]